jgi:outer membrane cobalamin receptor
MWRFCVLLPYCLIASTLDPVVVLAKKYEQPNFAFIETLNNSQQFMPGFFEKSLNNISGLTMVSNGGPGQLTYPRIQGAVREQSPIIWNEMPIATEDATLLPLSTGIVEVKKGVHCAELGNGVIGGTLNVIPFQKPEELNGEASLNFGNHHYYNQNLWWKKNKESITFQQHLDNSAINLGNTVAKRYRNQYSMQRSAFSGKRQFLNNLKSDNTHGETSIHTGCLSLNTLDSNKFYTPSDFRAKQSLQIYGFNFQADETASIQPYLRSLYTKSIAKRLSPSQATSFSKQTLENASLRSGVIIKKDNWIIQPGLDAYYQSLEQYAFLSKQKRQSRAEVALVNGIHFEQNNFQTKNWLRLQKPEHTNPAYACSNSCLLTLGQTSLSTHLGTGFRLPGLYERFSKDHGNANLKAEKAIGGNFGIAHTFGFGKLTALLFRTQSKEMIAFVNNKYVNRKRAVQKGFETSYEKKFGFKFIKASFTYTEAMYKKPFSRMQNVPRKAVGVQAGYDNAITFLEFGVKYTGPQIQPDYVDYSKIIAKGGYSTAFVSTSHLITENIKLNASIENLLNRSVESLPGYPQPKFQAIFGVTMQW